MPACIKFAIYFNKLPNVSYEHFYKHWASVHADLTVSSKPFAKHKIQRYTQVGDETAFLPRHGQGPGYRVASFVLIDRGFRLAPPNARAEREPSQNRGQGTRV